MAPAVFADGEIKGASPRSRSARLVVVAFKAEDNPARKPASVSNRRRDERYHLKSVHGAILHKGRKIPCLVLDVSLSGCRLRLRESFLEGALAPVMVSFAIHGMALTIWGETQWVRYDRELGIRFKHSTRSSQNQLAGMLAALVDESLTEVVMVAVAAEQAGQPAARTIALERPRTPPEPVQPVAEEAAASAEVAAAEEFQAPPTPPLSPPPLPSPRPTLESDHKVLQLEAGQSPGTVQLTGDAMAFEIDVMDLGRDGCLAKMRREFPVRFGAHAEIEFQMRGLHFRLPCKAASLVAPGTLEIRFVDMSFRKRGELAELIDELAEIAEKKAAAAAV